MPGCDTRHRSCVGYTLSIKAAALLLSRKLEWHRLLFFSSGTGRLLLGAGTADHPARCDARSRGCVGYTLSIKAAALALSEA